MNSRATVAWPPAESTTLSETAVSAADRRTRREKAGYGVRPPLPLLLTIGVHVAVLGWLLFDGATGSQPLPIAPVVVTMIEMAKPAPEVVHVPQPELNVTKAVVPEPELDIEQSNAPSTAIRQVVASATPKPAPVESVPVTQPRFDADYLNNPAPSYPAQSRRLREHGEVRLRVLVNREGLPVDVQISHSCGYMRLDQAALSAVRKWRFQPAQRGGVPVEAWVIVPIEFDVQSA